MKNGIRVLLVLVTLATPAICFDSLTTLACSKTDADLTPAAEDAVMTIFPEATIKSVSQEREAGVQYFDVLLRDGRQKIEMEVTADGTVGEIEYPVAWKNVPEKVRQTILAETQGAKPKRVDRHEIRGVPEGESFKTVSPPIVLHGIEYKIDGERHEIAVTTAGLVLTEEAD